MREFCVVSKYTFDVDPNIVLIHYSTVLYCTVLYSTVLLYSKLQNSFFVVPCFGKFKKNLQTSNPL